MARLALFGIAVIFVVIVARLIFPSSSKEPDPTEMVQDPNNGVYVPKKEAIKKTIHGKEYYFSTEQSAEEYIKKNQTKTG